MAQLIVLEHIVDGAVSRMWVEEELSVARISPDLAIMCGFKLEDGVWRRELTADVVEAEIARTAFLVPVKSWQWGRDVGELPDPALYRNAWRLKHGRVVVDMALARDMHRQLIRAARAPLLQKLDIEYQMADEVADPARKRARKRDVAGGKQLLRDATADPAIESAATPEELAQVWPAEIDRL